MGTGCRSPVLWRRGSAARTGRRTTRRSAQSLWPLLAPVGLGLVIAGEESWAIVSPNGLPVQVWLAQLEDAANHWAVESARLQLTAYEAAQAAHGAGRAIEFAKRGEPWRPPNVEEDIDALIAAQRALAR